MFFVVLFVQLRIAPQNPKTPFKICKILIALEQMVSNEKVEERKKFMQRKPISKD